MDDLAEWIAWDVDRRAGHGHGRPGATLPVPPPAPPTPAEAARQLAAEAARKLPRDANLAADAQKLSEVYKSLSGQIPAPIDSLDRLITANRYAREIALGPQRAEVWKPWVAELGQWLDRQRASGAITDVKDCRAIWIAIGEGLATVK